MKGAALVTGSAHRLGRDIALFLAKKNWHLFIHYNKSKSEAAQVLRLIKDSGGEGSLIKADISQYKDCVKMARYIKNKKHTLTILVNNVGEYATGELTQFPVESFNTIIQTNLVGCYYVTQTCLPLFSKKGGSIINIGFTGIGTVSACPENTAYTISKTGLLQLTKSYALSLAPKNIRVNMISPGHLQNSIDLPHNVQKIFPLGRAGLPGDILFALDFLLHKKAGYITGQNIEVAGGYMLGPLK